MLPVRPLRALALGTAALILVLLLLQRLVLRGDEPREPTVGGASRAWGAEASAFSPAQHAALRGVVQALLAESAVARSVGGPAVRWGCNRTAPAALAATARATSLLPIPPTHVTGPEGYGRTGFERRLDVVAWLAGVLGYSGAGVELGVKQGEFAEQVLNAWPACSAYTLVDPWRHQASYADVANVADAKHSEFMTEALQRTARFGSKVRVLRKMSFEAVADFADGDCSLDFVYVDAVHDYEGALRDLVDWWPKLRPGGIMAGHDYLDGINVAGVFGVQTAVDRFAAAVDRPVYMTNGYPSVDGAGKAATERGVLEWRSFVLIK